MGEMGQNLYGFLVSNIHSAATELAQVTAEGVATERDTDDSISSINLDIQDRTPRGEHGEDGSLR